MNATDLKIAVALGEDSSRQFKADARNVDALASEMVAFANTNGGRILIGVADDGSMPGLSREDIARINQLVSNAASQHVRSPLTVQSNPHFLYSQGAASLPRAGFRHQARPGAVAKDRFY